MLARMVLVAMLVVAVVSMPTDSSIPLQPSAPQEPTFMDKQTVIPKDVITAQVKEKPPPPEVLADAVVHPVVSQNATEEHVALPLVKTVDVPVSNVTASEKEGTLKIESELHPSNTTEAKSFTHPALIAGKDILIAVVTAPKHYLARHAIRNSYMLTAHQTGRIDVKFFVGELPDDFPNREQADQAITQEPHMVRLNDFQEAYHNLSYKALDIFKHGADHGYKSVLKVDDDTYVRVHLALEFFDQNHGDPHMWGGQFVSGANAVVDDPNSKWYMKDQYPAVLEDYANGPGFILGSEALQFIQNHYDTLFRYRVDDAAVGIWLKNTPTHKYPMKVDMYSHYVHEDVVWINPVNAEEMVQIHQGRTQTLQVCHETCLCWGGPMPEGECLGWGAFMTNGYQDLIPRLAFAQIEAERKN